MTPVVDKVIMENALENPDWAGEQKLVNTPPTQSSCSCCCKCCGACYKFAMIWPLGGIFGFIWCIATTSFVTTGIKDINSSLATLGLDITGIVRIANIISTFISIVNFVVFLYGLRESIRIYCGGLQHCNGPCILKCVTCCMKFWLKFTISSCTTLSFVVSVALLILVEAIALLIFLITQLCHGTSDAFGAINELLDQPGIDGTTNNPVDEICDTFEDLNDGLWNVFFNAVGLVFGTALVIAFWFKYSTMGLVQDEKKSRESEMTIKAGDFAVTNPTQSTPV